MDPEVVYSLEYEHSVTQSPPGDYSYVKWWESGPILLAEPRTKVETLEWRLETLHLWFPIYLHFLGFCIDLLLVFGGLTIFRQRGHRSIGYAWPSPPMD